MVIFVLFVLFGLILGWLAVISWHLYKTIRHYNVLTQNTGKDRLMSVMDEIIGKLRTNEEKSNSLHQLVLGLNESSKYHVQKIGFTRFNPFADTGGDHSFVLAFLDGMDTGVVITSMHNRRGTRWYVKPILQGKALEHELSEEERKAVESAKFINRPKH